MDTGMAFSLGIATGLALYKYVIAVAIGYVPHCRCDYCKWYAWRKDRHARR